MYIKNFLNASEMKFQNNIFPVRDATEKNSRKDKTEEYLVGYNKCRLEANIYIFIRM